MTARLEENAHPEQADRLCLGLLNLSRTYLPIHLNNSCRLANQEGLTRLKQITSILESRRDELAGHAIVTLELPQDHENIRGPQSFH